MFLDNIDITSFLNSKLSLLKSFSDNYPYEASLYYFFLSLLLLSLSFPVAFILGILAGIIFNPVQAIILVSFSSSIAATIAMLLSRFFFRDFLRKRYSRQYESIDNGFMINGVSYLFAIRMTPIFPYFLANLLVGLTTIKIIPYYLTTQVGMLPITTIIILLGNGLNEIILSNAKIDIEFLILLSLLGLLPIFFKFLFKKILN